MNAYAGTLLSSVGNSDVYQAHLLAGFSLKLPVVSRDLLLVIAPMLLVDSYKTRQTQQEELARSKRQIIFSIPNDEHTSHKFRISQQTK
jgi:hypothetical protein